jgi:uncharacterized secreted repeat protein (TIGR03808 family)
MTVDRRTFLSAGFVAGAALSGVPLSAEAGPRNLEKSETLSRALFPDAAQDDHTGYLQSAIDAAAAQNATVHLAPGRFRISNLSLRSGTRLIGSGPSTVLEFRGGNGLVGAIGARRIEVADLSLDGRNLALDPDYATSLLALTDCQDITLRNIAIRASLLHAISLKRCSGIIADCAISDVGQSGIFSIDGAGIDIRHNRITRCANNGIQVWRSETGEDGSVVSSNRIEHIAAKSGGSGENGNGINIFRAAGVLVSGNRITDCAYTAVRANAASNVQIVSNSCARLGEVALYAEFGFEGALIASNLVDTAASGIAVTNFNEGGRLAVVQGNLIRNLFRREFEARDKRGVGISIEADSLVTANTIENAPTAGILVGWGRYMRDCAATQNLIRNAACGILVSADPEAGQCLIAHNTISGAKLGAIRAMDGSGYPIGPDLAREGRDGGRVKITGNLSA